MGIYYPGDGSTVYSGNDKAEKVQQLRDEARQHDKNSEGYRRTGGYSGHMASEGLESVRKEKEANRIEKYGR